MSIDERDKAFEKWINQSEGYGLAFARDCWNAAYKVGQEAAEAAEPDNSIAARIAWSKEHSSEQPVGITLFVDGVTLESTVIAHITNNTKLACAEVFGENHEAIADRIVRLWNISMAGATTSASTQAPATNMSELHPLECRKAFEDWAESKGFMLSRYEEDEDPAYYIAKSTQSMWEAFCQGAAWNSKD